MKAEAGESAQRGSLVEHVEVTDSELLVHAFSDFEFSSLFGVTSFVVNKLDGARSSLTFDSKLDKFRRGHNGESFVERVELFADLGELT